MPSNPSRILVVEDDEPIRKFLRATLIEEGYGLDEAASAGQALTLAKNQAPDLVILDLGLPDMDGLELLRQFHGWLHAPVIVLSARGRENDKVAALDLGADDYLTKPFGVGELLARIRVAFRHLARVKAADQEEAAFMVGELTVDRLARRVTLRGKEVHLTPIEHKLLGALVRHAGRVITHRALLNEVWGPDNTGEVQYLRVFMAGLRRKLELDPAQPRYLLTEQGVGYRLVDE